MVFLSTLLLAVFVTIALIPLCSRLAFVLHAVDLPDPRKVHTRPTPRSGGIAMALGVFVPVVLWVPLDQFSRAFLVAAAVIVAFGLLDDIRSLSYQVKFAAQWIAALIVVLWGGVEIRSLGDLLPAGRLVPHWIGAALATLAIVGVTNAINLSDGLDGLAGGISMLGFIGIGFAAYESNDLNTTLLATAVIGAIFGFLRFNTHPANLFMGDAGSQLLGFSAITLSLRVSQGPGGLSPLMPLLLLGFPVLDTLAVMLERIAAGRSPFKPDKNHFHHKLMRLGFDHKEAVLTIYLLQSLLVSLAFLLRFQSDRLLLGIYVAFSGLILSGFHVAEKAGWKRRHHDFIDGFLKAKLRKVHGEALLIRTSFRVVEAGLPLLLFLTWLIPGSIPVTLSGVGLACAVILGLIWRYRCEWMGGALKTTLYLSIPFAVYLSDTSASSRLPGFAIDLYNSLFGILVLFVLLTLKLTRRNKGFRTTPMDFLTIFVTLVVPNLPDPQLRQYGMGLLSAKIIAFFFSYEVLMGELRGEYNRLYAVTLVTLLTLGLRGIL